MDVNLNRVLCPRSRCTYRYRIILDNATDFTNTNVYSLKVAESSDFKLYLISIVIYNFLVSILVGGVAYR